MTTQNIIIFGAYGGIGQALCEQLSAEGHQLRLVGRDQHKLEALAEQCQQSWAHCDGTHTDQVEQVVKNAIDEWGHVNGIVNLIGSVLLKPAHLLSHKDFEQCIQTNLTSAFAVVRAIAKHQLDQPSVTILMSTAAAHLGLANHEAIAAAKMGIEGLMKSAASSYAKHRLRFNCVAPGLTHTPLTDHIFQNERGKTYSQSLHPVGRLGKPQDIANMIRFLLSPDNDWITGQVFTVDGGLSTLKA